ncbi:hypothetical protein G5714_024691 [Onychostoma macrolepis]|uniref:Uncharacterized protein n=1 Tax=Onychostoma macrolepis TaxID=369639 RepID=A0A7J6BIU9_9TELE|nr:hypothetical protein G5714_024691 [Onychostoma macrolepis]
MRQRYRTRTCKKDQLMRQRPPRVRFPPRPPLAPSTVSLPPLRGRGEGGASSAARGPEVLPSAAAGGSEPPPLPARRGPPTLVRGRTSFWWEGSLRLSRPLWGAGRAAATRPLGSARTGGLDPQLSRRRADAVVAGDARPWGFPDGVRCAPGGDRLDSGQPPVPLGGGGRRRHVRSVLRGPGVSTPNSRADGRTPSFVGGDARPWGFPDGVRCAPGGDRLDSGQPPVPLGIAERPPRPPPSTTSVAASEEGRAQRRIPAPATGRGKCGVQKTALSARAGGPSPSDGGLARGRCEAGSGPRPAGVRFFLESGCLGMQPKDSTRRVRSARSVRVDPLRWGPPPGRWLGRRRAHFFRGGAPRPAPVWPGRVGGRRWLAASGSRALQSPHAPTLPLTPGVVGSVLAPSLLPTGEGRGPSLPVCASTGADCPQSVSDRAAPSGRGSGPRKGCSRSAARSATHPTRLETRTKESNARASQRVSSSPHGAMKVKAGARRSRWDPPAPAGGAPPARLARTAGQVELERVRWYPKDGELCLGRAKPEETLVEARSGPDVQIGRPTWV